MRKTRPIAAALLLSLAPATLSPVARAQSTAEDPTTAIARARFKEGVEFYDKGDYEQARLSFLQAYALKKHPAVLLNLAWSCLKSGHAMEADKYFKQFLAEGKDITDKQRSDANDGLTQTRARVGRIEVSAAAGTEVTIDGERVGNAPLAEPVAVEIGAHTVKFKGTDGTIDTQSVTVMGGEKVAARFKATSTAPAAVGPAPAPTTPGPETAPSPAPPAKRATPPSEEAGEQAESKEAPKHPAAAEAEGRSVFAPPKNLVPVYILAGAAVVLYAGAGLLAYFKDQAQGKADDLKTLITSPSVRGTCPVVTQAAAVRYGAACDAWQTDISQANDDATWANVLLGFGIAATAGAVVYWFIADKRDEGHAASTPRVSPVLGPNTAGVSLSTAF
jgi:Tfp pilus assembly protein PilF